MFRYADFLFGQDLHDTKTKRQSLPDIDVGQWIVFLDKANAIILQRLIVPWLVALYELKYAKSIKLETIKEMVIALCPQLDFVNFDAEEASRTSPVGFAEISKRAKFAAGAFHMMNHIECLCFISSLSIGLEYQLQLRLEFQLYHYIGTCPGFA